MDGATDAYDDDLQYCRDLGLIAQNNPIRIANPLDTGVLVLFDRRSSAEDIETRTRFEEAVTPTGRKVTLLRA
jgi:hypothetical protein